MERAARAVGQNVADGDGLYADAAERETPGTCPEVPVGLQDPPGGRRKAAGLALGLAVLEFRVGARGGAGTSGNGALPAGLHLQSEHTGGEDGPPLPLEGAKRRGC